MRQRNVFRARVQNRNGQIGPEESLWIIIRQLRKRALGLRPFGNARGDIFHFLVDQTI
jgi:hypothetical protein